MNGSIANTGIPRSQSSCGVLKEAARDIAPLLPDAGGDMARSGAMIQTRAMRLRRLPAGRNP